MKTLLFFLILLTISSCHRCKSKAKILTQRQESIKNVEKKHGNIIPESIYEVPDLDECSL